jgi:hypothetical protein
MLLFLIVHEQQNTIARLPGDPAQNANINRMSFQKSRLEGDMQRGPLDSGMNGSNNSRTGNPDGIRLREVSELRSCLSFRLTL